MVKHFFGNIDLARKWYAHKFYEIILITREDMIVDALTKPNALYNYTSIEANRLGIKKLPIYAQEGDIYRLLDIYVSHFFSCYV